MAGRREERLRKRERNRKRCDNILNSPRLEDLDKEHPHLRPNPEGPIYRADYTVDTRPETTCWFESLNLYTDQEVEVPKVFRGLKIRVEFQERAEAKQHEADIARLRETIIEDEELFPGTSNWEAHITSTQGKAELDRIVSYFMRKEEAETAADKLDEVLGASVESIKVFEANDVFSLLVSIVPGIEQEVPVSFQGFSVCVCDPIQL